MYKILVVEDDRIIAQALASHLRRWDYETKCVEDLKNIMDEFRQFEPHLVLLDIIGSHAAVLQWISLVSGNPEDIGSADYFPVFCQ